MESDEDMKKKRTYGAAVVKEVCFFLFSSLTRFLVAFRTSCNFVSLLLTSQVQTTPQLKKVKELLLGIKQDLMGTRAAEKEDRDDKKVCLFVCLFTHTDSECHERFHHHVRYVCVAASVCLCLCVCARARVRVLIYVCVFDVCST